MKTICPRMIRGNRGDLASRYGILSQLNENGIHDVTVYCDSPSDIFSLPFKRLPYGRLYNLVPRLKNAQAFLSADIVVWTAGIDLQDDSSLLKLCHMLCAFLLYRLCGKRVYVIMQGAGPLVSVAGRALVRCIINLTNAFIVRDSGSFQLLCCITKNKNKLLRGYDGIFCGHFPCEATLPASDSCAMQKKKAITIGFNIRLWYHFSNGILPYHMQRKAYQNRSQERMERLISASCSAIRDILARFPATIKLISMYEPGAMTWEDDAPILSLIKQQFLNDARVLLPDEALGLQDFCALVSELDVMIGMRLHATLIALRFGVPAITLNYTLKGKDIFRDMGLSEYVIELEDFVNSSAILASKVNLALSDENLKDVIQSFNKKACDTNKSILETLLRK